MAPMEQVVEDAVPNVWDVINQLCEAEMAEQSLWETSIPAWHPRCDGTDAGDGSGDGSGDGDGTGGTGDGDTGDGTPDPAQAAVDAAYAKLRDAEKERDRLKGELTKAQRKDLEENERLKAELEDARLESAALQEKVDRAERARTIETIATTMKFKKPAVASRFVDSDVTDEKGIKDALKDAIKDIPELVGDGAPPPPINNDDKNNNGSQNARMNAALRKAAGRA